MFESAIPVEGTKYQTFGLDKAFLDTIPIDHIKHQVTVPIAVYSPGFILYNVIGVKPQNRRRHPRFAVIKPPFNIIKFGEYSCIEWIPISFIVLCKQEFYLPPMIKRISMDTNTKPEKMPKIILTSNSNKYLSVNRKNEIMNIQPLEIVSTNSDKSRHILRETIRIIGNNSFESNKKLRKVVFPPSVEKIGNYAFYHCTNLRIIIFKGVSKLRSIGAGAFFKAAVEELAFGPSLEEIGNLAFGECHSLVSVSFPIGHEPREISSRAFEGTNIKLPEEEES